MVAIRDGHVYLTDSNIGTRDRTLTPVSDSGLTGNVVMQLSDDPHCIAVFETKPNIPSA